MYKAFVKPALFYLDAGRAHHLVFDNLRRAARDQQQDGSGGEQPNKCVFHGSGEGSRAPATRAAVEALPSAQGWPQ